MRDPLGPLPEDGPLGRGVGLWFAVDGPIVERHDSLLAAGATILRAPYDTPFGRALTLADPDGYTITLHERNTVSR